MPIPDIRINIEFCFRFSSRDKELAAPIITFRIEDSKLVHKDLKNIDYHILRVLKAKTLWFENNPFPLENASVLDTRLLYDANSASDLIGPAPNDVTSALEENEKVESTLELEKTLITMFSGADDDGNGYLDPDEFKNLLLESELGFTEPDVELILDMYDENNDGKLIYREFIPIAVDVIQAQRAMQYAAEKDENIIAEAKASAEKRMEGLQKPLEEAIMKWRSLDKTKTGALPERQVKTLLSEDLPVKLAAEEVEMLMMTMDFDEDDKVLAYTNFTQSYESLMIETMQELYLEKNATDVECYLRHLFCSEDEDMSGELHVNVIQKVLLECERIRLTAVQIRAVLAHRDGNELVDYRNFSRKAAMMIYKLFDRKNLNAKRSAIERSSITPIELLAGNTRKRVESQMRARFREFDNDDDGYLSAAEFNRCITDTGLAIAQVDIDKLFASAAAGAPKISIAQFMKFAYGPMLQLARDAALRLQFQGAV
jgi:Ca2+-binding EF-hand superfamily protein